jgi:hypothetical protein
MNSQPPREIFLGEKNGKKKNQETQKILEFFTANFIYHCNELNLQISSESFLPRVYTWIAEV